MTIQEIRIGNYIRHNVLDDVSQFVEPNEDAIGEDDMLHFLGGDGLDKAEPIPLTEEWLRKLGFEKSYDGWDGYLSPPLGEGRIRILNNVWNCGYCYVQLKYVHQLQNLFYALQQTELTIKP